MERRVRKRARQVGIDSNNRYDEVINATGVDDFLAKTDAKGQPIDMHPEKRMKAAWRSHTESQMEQLKKEHPKLKRSQLIQMISKEVDLVNL